MNPLTRSDIEAAQRRLAGVVRETPLEYSERLSAQYHAQIYLKREDLQPVRSYKLRGAYNVVSMLSEAERARGVVCASAGNHAQGVAYACRAFKVRGTIYMPTTTPRQKIDKVRSFGGRYVHIVLEGTTYDACSASALAYADRCGAAYVHPFDDYRTMAGQGTIGIEIVGALPDVTHIIVPIGGGGLCAGVGSYVKAVRPTVSLLGVEPRGAAGMSLSIERGKVTPLDTLDTFVDGAAVRTVGTKTFKIVRSLLDDITTVHEGAVCSTMIDLYQKEGVIAEPAGALSIAALEEYKDLIVGRTVVCILSGGNNDISRYPEIVEKSLVYHGLKHYFIIEFYQKPGELRTFVTKVLGPSDDIARFEYIKKTNKEKGPALVGIELARKDDLAPLLARMDTLGINYTHVREHDALYGVLV